VRVWEAVEAHSGCNRDEIGVQSGCARAAIGKQSGSNREAIATLSSVGCVAFLTISPLAKMRVRLSGKRTKRGQTRQCAVMEC